MCSRPQSQPVPNYRVSPQGCSSLLSPRKRGPSKHRLSEFAPISAIDVLEYWVPAFAGTTPNLDEAQEYYLRIDISSSLKLFESLRRPEARIRRLLHDDQRALRKPAAVTGRDERLLGQAPAIGRVEEPKRERLDRMCRTEPGGIAAENAGCAAEPERRDILAQQCPRLRGIIDEQRESSPARERLKAKRTGAGKQVEHACARDRIAIRMGKDVEQRLAQPIARGPDCLRAGRGERAPTEAAADDAHQRLLRRKRRRFSRRASSGSPNRSASK